jgi:hypothetical protein
MLNISTNGKLVRRLKPRLLQEELNEGQED